MIEYEACALTLQLNRNNSKLICSHPTSMELVLLTFSGIRILNMEDATVLRSLLSSFVYVDRCIREKVERLNWLGEELFTCSLMMYLFYHITH